MALPYEIRPHAKLSRSDTFRPRCAAIPSIVADSTREQLRVSEMRANKRQRRIILIAIASELNSGRQKRGYIFLSAATSKQLNFLVKESRASECRVECGRGKKSGHIHMYTCWDSCNLFQRTHLICCYRVKAQSTNYFSPFCSFRLIHSNDFRRYPREGERSEAMDWKLLATLSVSFAFGFIFTRAGCRLLRRRNIKIHKNE